jgi:2-keto-3-deoxy-L-rhamnonate aldolase RhmA
MIVPMSDLRSSHVLSLAMLLLGGLTACGRESALPDEQDTAAMAETHSSEPGTDLMRRLVDGHAILGVFSGDKTLEQGREVASERQTDFVFYSLESGPFDIPTMETYLQGLREGAGSLGIPSLPLLLRVPPLHEDPEAAPDRVARGLAAGAAGLVFPHVIDAQEAALAVDLMADAAMGESSASHLVVLIVEDRAGVENVRDIAATDGVSVVFAGPGDLRRAYDEDIEQVENAIQAVLAACLESDVPCGVTAGVDDIGIRLEQGFRVIIVNEAEALPVGREAARRVGS